MTSDIYYYGFYNESSSFLIPVHRESLVRASRNHSRSIAVFPNDIKNFAATSIVHYEYEAYRPVKYNILYFSSRPFANILNCIDTAQFGLLFETRVN